MYAQIIAHRGPSNIPPANTLPAFAPALQLSLDGVELDVRLSADGHPVVIHDRLLERTTSGNGPVEKLTLTELRTLDAGAHFSDAFQGEQIPLLSEVLDIVNGKLLVQIEMKGQNNRLAGAIVNAANQHYAASHTMLTSFKLRLLREIHHLSNVYSIGLLVSPIQDLPSSPKTRAAKMSALAYSAKADVVLAHHGLIDPETVAEIKRLGMDIRVRTVDNTKDLLRMFTLGVSSLTTHEPEQALDIRNTYKLSPGETTHGFRT